MEILLSILNDMPLLPLLAANYESGSIGTIVTMNTQIFDALRPYLNHYVEDLRRAKPSSVKELRHAKGLYLLSEVGVRGKNKNLYVGITGSLNRRITQHQSTSVQQATLAVKLARIACKTPAIYTSRSSAVALFGKGGKRKHRSAFFAARARIKKMQVRVNPLPRMKEDDLHILEMYAAKALKTPYNEFNLH